MEEMSICSRPSPDPKHGQSKGLIGENSKVFNNCEISALTWLAQFVEGHYFPASLIIQEAPLVKHTKNRVVRLKDLFCVPNAQVLSATLLKLANKGKTFTLWWEEHMETEKNASKTKSQMDSRSAKITRYFTAYPWREDVFCNNQKYRVVSQRHKNTLGFALEKVEA